MAYDIDFHIEALKALNKRLKVRQADANDVTKIRQADDVLSECYGRARAALDVLGLNGTILQSNNYVNPFVVAAKGQEAMLTTDFAQCVRESIQRAGDAVGILDTEKQQGHPSLDTVRADRAAKQKALDDAREAKKKAAEEDRKNAEAPSKPAAPPVSPMVKRVGWAIVFGAAIFSAGVLLRYITTPEADRSALLASVQGSIVLDSVVIALLMIGEYSKRWAK